MKIASVKVYKTAIPFIINNDNVYAEDSTYFSHDTYYVSGTVIKSMYNPDTTIAYFSDGSISAVPLRLDLVGRYGNNLWFTTESFNNSYLVRYSIKNNRLALTKPEEYIKYDKIILPLYDNKAILCSDSKCYLLNLETVEKEEIPNLDQELSEYKETYNNKDNIYETIDYEFKGLIGDTILIVKYDYIFNENTFEAYNKIYLLSHKIGKGKVSEVYLNGLDLISNICYDPSSSSIIVSGLCGFSFCMYIIMLNRDGSLTLVSKKQLTTGSYIACLGNGEVLLGISIDTNSKTATFKIYELSSNTIKTYKASIPDNAELTTVRMIETIVSNDGIVVKMGNTSLVFELTNAAPLENVDPIPSFAKLTHERTLALPISHGTVEGVHGNIVVINGSSSLSNNVYLFVNIENGMIYRVETASPQTEYKYCNDYMVVEKPDRIEVVDKYGAILYSIDLHNVTSSTTIGCNFALLTKDNQLKALINGRLISFQISIPKDLGNVNDVVINKMRCISNGCIIWIGYSVNCRNENGMTVCDVVTRPIFISSDGKIHENISIDVNKSGKQNCPPDEIDVCINIGNAGTSKSSDDIGISFRYNGNYAIYSMGRNKYFYKVARNNNCIDHKLLSFIIRADSKFALYSNILIAPPIVAVVQPGIPSPECASFPYPLTLIFGKLGISDDDVASVAVSGDRVAILTYSGDSNMNLHIYRIEIPDYIMKYMDTSSSRSNKTEIRLPMSMSEIIKKQPLIVNVDRLECSSTASSSEAKMEQKIESPAGYETVIATNIKKISYQS